MYTTVLEEYVSRIEADVRDNILPFWTTQAEAVVGFLNAFQDSGDERVLDAALKYWDYIDERVIDRENGERFSLIKTDGRVDPDRPKIGFWKCPCHNSRACFEASDRLRSILAN